jgi:hypothetical protein
MDWDKVHRAANVPISHPVDELIPRNPCTVEIQAQNIEMPCVLNIIAFDWEF